jgi:hypothetical protein
MKKLWFLSFIVIPIFMLVLFTGCPAPTSNNGGSSGGSSGGGSGSFTYDGSTYPLTGAGIDIYPAVPSFEVSIVSSGINVPPWTGTGHIVWFDLTSPSTQGEPGTYNWAFTAGFELWEAAISFDYDADTDLGTWIDADWALANSGDYITISVNGSTYTFEFSLTMDDGKTVTGSYTGPVTIW